MPRQDEKVVDRPPRPRREGAVKGSGGGASSRSSNTSVLASLPSVTPEPSHDRSARRKILSASAGVTAASLIGPAAAADGQPPGLYGSVKDGKVTLPPLHAASDGGEHIANPKPLGKRLGVVVVGIGHLALEQIIPAFGSAGNVRLTALVSGHHDKALAVAAQHNVPVASIYDYGSFDWPTHHYVSNRHGPSLD